MPDYWTTSGQQQDHGWLQETKNNRGPGIQSSGDCRKQRIIPGPGSSQAIQTRMWNSRNLSVELTENLGLPVTLLESHNPWPAYVTYTSPAVRRLIDKSRARDLECVHSMEETRKPTRLSKPSFMHLRRKKSSKSSELMLKDALSETRLSTWEPCSATNMSSTLLPEPTRSQMEAREGPTSSYNKIIFSRRPVMRKLPYDLLQASKETHANA